MEINYTELLALSKKEAVQLAKEQATEIAESGVQDPLKVYIETKKIAEFCTELNKGLAKPAQDEAARYGKQGAEMWGAKATIVSTPSRYDYSNCNDAELTVLEDQLATAKKALEARQKFLQSVPDTGTTIVNEDSGDVLKIYPPARIQGETLKVAY